MAVISFTPRVFPDARGWFSETYHRKTWREAGITADFCQDNQSFSRQAGSLRGLHYQGPPAAQAKLVRCLHGSIWDVAVDIRRGSPTYGDWVALLLSGENRRQLFIPEGFLHGFLTLEPDCEVAYKCSAFYDPAVEGGIAWNDQTLSIAWPLADRPPLLSDRDAGLPGFERFASPFVYDGVPLTPLDDGETSLQPAIGNLTA